MQKIITKAIKHFECRPRVSDTEILNYFEGSFLYSNQMSTRTMLAAVRKRVAQSHKDILRRLDLHFSRQANKLLFDIFQIILRTPQGMLYKQIETELKNQPSKTDIIAISHYCRKLYKANFITVSYIKEGTLVAARRYRATKEDMNLDSEEAQPTPQLKTQLSQGFLIKELSIDNNIRLNMIGMESLLKDGLTKEEICGNIFKVSQRKTISRLIESSKPIRDGERKGRIYEFRFKGDFSKMKAYTEKHIKVPSKTQIVTLTSQVEEHIQSLNPDIECDNLLQYLIDHSDQPSSRQCDSLKLSRFIYILNHLNQSPCTRQNMLTHIIEQDKVRNRVNLGTMHKKSLLTILKTLERLELVRLEGEVLYPVWKNLDKLAIGTPQSTRDVRPIRKKEKIEHYRIVPLREGQQQFTAELIFDNIRSSLRSMLQDAFKRIKAVSHTKAQAPVQRFHVLHLLELQDRSSPLDRPQTYQELCDQIDGKIRPYLKLEEQVKFVDPEIKKYLRTYPTKKVSDLLRRFGKNSLDKIQELRTANLVKFVGERKTQSYEVTLSEHSYMI